ncbi:MAG: TIGR04013 family B12-binding domain/radical SAM domain-containing protein [Candidatus Heimdallarchaeota archaeon]|nr:TIGR04013 family B12-binding domain/radical SAM domain-containing protein [Candidatus Heimdallarchaeota archaeon]
MVSPSTNFSNDKNMNKLGITFYYAAANRYSYNALIGAIEIDPNLSKIPVFIPRPSNFFKKIRQLFKLRGFEHLIVGLSSSTFQIRKITNIITKLNTHPKRKDMTIVAGGPHPSALPQEMLDKGVDVVVIGEGEKTFPEIITKISQSSSIIDLRGIAYQTSSGDIVISPKNEPIDLNEYPPFAPTHELYSAIEIARGCPFGCKFCQVASLFGKKVRFRDPQIIKNWGKFLLSKRDQWDFRFIAPNAFGYKSKHPRKPNLGALEKLLSGLKNLEARKNQRTFFGTFPSEVRPESVTEDTLQLVKDYCDNDNLTIGAQSGSPRILKIIGRGHTIDDVRKAVDLTLSYGFQLNIDFILGFPEEKAEDQYLTLEFCKELVSKGCKIHMHYLIPLPGTEYYNKKPTPIVPEIESVLRRWSNEGIIFGSWQYQRDKMYDKYSIDQNG